MFQTERIETILNILKKNGYVTVKYLTEELQYSNATINRDLTVMEKQKLVKRSYGGVELLEKTSVPLPFRYHKMKSAKNKIGQRAAEFVQDGDTIFVDASTTAEYLGRHLTDKKDVTVITNNMALVMFLNEYHIEAVCLGGNVVETPSMLMGAETIENAGRHHVDKMFFSTGAVTSDGKIGENDLYYPLHRIMMENADRCFYLVDHDKVDKPYKWVHYLKEGDYIITDYRFDEVVKEKYKHVTFVEA